jgi:D-serine deaminase-like pyridoxal phosphate-dependent protein
MLQKFLDPDCGAFVALRSPCLVLNRPALEDNIRIAADLASTRSVALRPHIKTHKCGEIAKLQLKAGACGIACATLTEAHDLVMNAVITDILLTSPVVGIQNVRALFDLHRRASLTVTVDHADHVKTLAEASPNGVQPLRVLIDVDVGQQRGGITNLRSLREIAAAIVASPRLSFKGLQGFAGHAQHIVDEKLRKDTAGKAAAFLRLCAVELERHGIAADTVSGSGTGTFGFDSSDGPYTELQTGSYVFMDADYGRLRHTPNKELPFKNALFVLATVISANHEDQVTVDAGTKAIAFNGPAPKILLGVSQGSTFAFAGDEHGIIKIPPGSRKPPIGSKILIEPTHCDPTVNLYDAYHVIDDNGVLCRWPIIGRYQS